MSNEFQVPEVVRVYRVTDLKAEYIVSGYRSVIDPAQIPEWEKRAAGIEVTSEDEVEKMAAARELRLMIRQSRIAAEAKRKELKEAALQESKAIDGLGRAIRERLEGAEKYLKDQEEFAQRAQEERERLRREEADRLLREKEEREAREAAEARAAEEKRIREENERLRAEAVEREKAMEAERQLHAEEQAKRDAELRKKQEAERIEREAAERKAAEERERERAAHAEELRKARSEAERRDKLIQECEDLLASLVVCPECGCEFDARGRHPEEL